MEYGACSWLARVVQLGQSPERYPFMRISLRKLVLAFSGLTIFVLIVSQLPRNVRIVVDAKHQDRVAMMIASQGESSWASRTFSNGTVFYLYNLGSLDRVVNAIVNDSRRYGYRVKIEDNFLLRLIYTKRNDFLAIGSYAARNIG